MTGLPDMNYPAFAAAAAMLRAQGLEVTSPAELNAGLEHEGWQACMRRDVAALAACDAIYLLPGWPASRGARAEWRLAVLLGLEVLFAPGAQPSTKAYIFPLADSDGHLLGHQVRDVDDLMVARARRFALEAARALPPAPSFPRLMFEIERAAVGAQLLAEGRIA